MTFQFQSRDYQYDAERAIWTYFAGRTGNPVVAMPTGTGKAIVIAMFCYNVLVQFPTQRIQVLTHVKELIRQNAQRITDVWPQAPVGVYSAGLKRRELDKQITVAGIQSLVRKGKVIDGVPVPNLILIDECHLLSPNDTSRYQVYIAWAREHNPFVKVIGFSATPYRIGQGMITDGGLFTDICIDMTGIESFNWFIENGYLVPLYPRPMNTTIDMTNVHMSGGDWNQKELETATEKVAYGAIKEAMQYAAHCKKILVFCAGKENAEHVAAYLNAFGRRATFVHDGVSDIERDERIEGFKNGGHNGYDAITNNNILTTGFDDPEIDCIIVLRKTTSPGLWVQMLGRGTRPCYLPGIPLDTAEGRLYAIRYSQKPGCLVLDFARNTRDLGPINDPRIPGRPGSGSGDAPIKICSRDKLLNPTPQQGCGWYNHTSKRYCDVCHGEFDFNVPFYKTSGEDAVIKSEAPVYEWYDVNSVQYSIQQSKEKGTPMLKVTYQTRGKAFREFILLEHKGLPGHEARMWWRARTNEEPPDNVIEAFEKVAVLRQPRKIRVHINTKWPEVTNYEY